MRNYLVQNCSGTTTIATAIDIIIQQSIGKVSVFRLTLLLNQFMFAYGLNSWKLIIQLIRRMDRPFERTKQWCKQSQLLRKVERK